MKEQRAATRSRFTWNRFQRTIAPYIFISPFYILFAIFMGYPFLFSLYLSFQRWNGLGPMRPVGLQNYTNLVNDQVFLQSLANSVILFFQYVPVLLLSALVLAVLLNSGYLKLQSMFRAVIFLPYVTSLIAISYVFSLLLDRDYGLLNLLLGMVGIPKIGWLSTPTMARISLDFLVIWRWLGYNMVLMLAGLQSIDTQLYEAAKIDGANTLQVFWRITFPLMRPVLLFCLMLSTIGTFSLFTEPLVLTGGGPANATITPVLYLYQQGFNYLKFGYASAIAYVYFVIMAALTLIEMRYLGGQPNA